MGKLKEIVEDCYYNDLYSVEEGVNQIKDLMLKWALWNHLRIKECEVLGKDCIIDSEIALDKFLKETWEK